MQYTTCVRILILLGFSVFAAAQNASVSLNGQVTDASGAAIPSASVKLHGLGDPLQQTTNEQGIYSFPRLASGKYTLQVTKAGFSPFEAGTDISGASKMDVAMTVTLEAQKVDVREEQGGVTVDPNANAGALIIRGADLEALSDDPDQLAQDLQALAGPSAGPNGGQIFIDGFSGGRVPPKASIREIRVNQNPFSAEHDRLGFGRIEIFTKPGSDRFRGQLMTMFSDNLFNARNPFVSSKPDFQSRMFMGSIGGPITKKSSFNFDLEHRALDENAVINATILDANLFPTRFSQAILTPQSRLSLIPRFDLQLNDKNTLAGDSVIREQPIRTRESETSPCARAYDANDRDNTLQLTETAALSSHAINETRLHIRSRSQQNGDTSIPTINVLDSFTAGGSQVSFSIPPLGAAQHYIDHLGRA
ncbi:MAG: carboxypeptidase regulatory-like domain-containing protein [Bryobacteraceae bacterium]